VAAYAKDKGDKLLCFNAAATVHTVLLVIPAANPFKIAYTDIQPKVYLRSKSQTLLIVRFSPPHTGAAPSRAGRQLQRRLCHCHRCNITALDVRCIPVRASALLICYLERPCLLRALVTQGALLADRSQAPPNGGIDPDLVNCCCVRQASKVQRTSKGSLLTFADPSKKVGLLMANRKVRRADPPAPRP
jgi:hypothetical protein